MLFGTYLLVKDTVLMGIYPSYDNGIEALAQAVSEQLSYYYGRIGKKEGSPEYIAFEAELAKIKLLEPCGEVIGTACIDTDGEYSQEIYR